MKSLVALLSRPGAPSSMPLPERLQPTALMARARALVRQFNQRNQRERLLLCAALVAVTYMLADALWLASAFTAFRSARTADASMQTALSAQRQQMEDARQQGARQAQRRQAELLDWRQRVRQGDATLRTHEDALVGPDRMVGLLEQLLARHGEVRVRAMRSLGRQDLLAPATAAANPGGPAPAPAQLPAAGTPGGPSSLYRHGVELVLEGGFADLLSYLRAMESLPQRVLWGSVSLKVDQYPRSVLTLRVYTLSRDANWLEI